MTHETLYNGFEITVHGEFIKGERATYDTPMTPDTFNIDDIEIDGDRREFWYSVDLQDLQRQIADEITS